MSRVFPTEAVHCTGRAGVLAETLCASGEMAEILGKETIDLYNTSDTRGTSQSYGRVGKCRLAVFLG